MDGADLCCGMGGSYTVKFHQFSMAILAKKLRCIEESNVQVVTMHCPDCLLKASMRQDCWRKNIKATPKSKGVR